jgi:hypothetical protein
MTTEATLTSWTGPSSATEQEKQERTERMVREAIVAHPGFKGCDLSTYAKGSYPNNTNVRADSDVDIAVQCHEVIYWGQEDGAAHTPVGTYGGPWTPAKLRAETNAALRSKFGSVVDARGATAIRVHSSTARVDADVVPCFDYRYYFRGGGHRDGHKVFRTNGETLVNWPQQHLAEGRAKNTATSRRFKEAVRILKRTENAMLDAAAHREVASFLIECLVYNCPNQLFLRPTWTERLRGILFHVWENTQGDSEPSTELRWREVSRCKWLFGGQQAWCRRDAREFSRAAWNYLGFAT